MTDSVNDQEFLESFDKKDSLTIDRNVVHSNVIQSFTFLLRINK
jgi:hypothetical protein